MILKMLIKEVIMAHSLDFLNSFLSRLFSSLISCNVFIIQFFCKNIE